MYSNHYDQIIQKVEWLKNAVNVSFNLKDNSKIVKFADESAKKWDI